MQYMDYFKKTYCYKVKNALSIGGNQYRNNIFWERHLEFKKACCPRIQNHLF